MIGVNVSGPEYSWMPYPTGHDLDYLKSQGVTLIRLPISWERMQGTLNGALDQNYLNGLETVLHAADVRGMQVIVDVHNYGRYNPNYAQQAAANYGIKAPEQWNAPTIGSAQVPISAFANFWGQMAAALNGRAGLAYYDLMNEPHDMGNLTVWPAAAQAAVDAIRQHDTGTKILVEGNRWSSAFNWPANNANLNITDPSHKITYEGHVYFDGDGSGRYQQTYDQQGAYPNIGVDRVQPFVDWLHANNAQGFIGEFGVPNTPQWIPVLDNFIQELKHDNLGGTYWNYVYPDPSGKNSWWPTPVSQDPMQIRDDGTGHTQLDHLTPDDVTPPPPPPPPPDDTHLVRGGHGNDVLVATNHHDVLTGYDGADRFVFKTLATSPAGNPDVVQDFHHSQHDKIDLRGIEKTALGGDTFHFIGSNDFTGNAGDLRFDKASHEVQGDTDGDGQADVEISMHHVANLVKGDFLL